MCHNAVTRVIRPSQRWPCPGTVNTAHSKERMDLLYTYQSFQTTFNDIVCVWLHALEYHSATDLKPLLKHTLFCVGVTLLCWRAMPGAEFSPGPVSERWQGRSTIMPSASQRDSDTGNPSVSQVWHQLSIEMCCISVQVFMFAFRENYVTIFGTLKSQTIRTILSLT